MNIKPRIKELFSLCQELEEVAANDDFLDQVRAVVAESDQEEDYNTSDCLSFLEDLDYAIKNDYETMQDFYDDY